MRPADLTVTLAPQTWTNQCIFGHNIAALRSSGYGENVAMGFSNFDDAVKAWLAEGSLYNYNNPGFSDATGHFTCVCQNSSATAPG